MSYAGPTLKYVIRRRTPQWRRRRRAGVCLIRFNAFERGLSRSHRPNVVVPSRLRLERSTLPCGTERARALALRDGGLLYAGFARSRALLFSPTFHKRIR